MNSLTSVLKSPSVWTGKDGVSAVTDLLKNPPLQDKIQFGLMKSSFDTLVKTGEIVTPGTDLKAPTGLLYNAAANAGKSLISPTAGLTELPKSLGSLASGSLSNLTSGLSGALGGLKGAAGGLTGALSGAAGGLTGALSGATGALSGALGNLGGAASSITGNLASVSSLANKGTAQLGGLLANASKFGVGTAVDWAKGSTGATSAISGLTGALAGGAAGAAGALSGALGGAVGGLTSGLKSQMDSLAKQGQFAVNFSDTKLPAAVAGIVPAAGFKGTIDRSTLNAATAKLVGSDKIGLPDFSPQAVDTSALTDAAAKAKGLLAGGLDAAGALARASGAGGLGSITASINGAVNTATSALSSVTGDAAGAVSGALGKLPYTGTDSITLARLGLSPDPLTAIKSRLG